MADEIVRYVQLPPGSNAERVRYPGEKTLELRRENLEPGVPMDPDSWRHLQELQV